MPKFVPRQRKHKAIARVQKANADNPVDSNATEVLPTAQKDGKEARRLILKEQLAAENGIVSGKKRKRLDKYIETKLKKEENQALLRKLEKVQAITDPTLYWSSKNLGRNGETKKEALKRAAKERREGIDVEKNEEILFERPRLRSTTAQTEEREESSDEEAADNEATRQAHAPPVQQATSFGTGLKRPLELGEDGRPIIKKRKKGKGVPIKFTLQPPIPEAEVFDEDIPWDGFSSSEGESGVESSDENIDEESQSDQDESEVSVANSDDDSQSSEQEDSDETTSESSTDENVDAAKARRKERTSAFKAWATQQVNAAVGFTPSAPATEQHVAKPANFIPRPIESDPLPRELQPTKIDRKAYAVTVQRSDTVQASRIALPVVAEEQKIMEAVHSHDVVVIWGATGSGKTTQVPQFLFESGFGAKDSPTPGLIGVTQPRRVASVSMAKRVSEELGDKSDQVAHQIRFDTSVSDKTAIKFMTDGVLLREVAQDFALEKYSAIIIDEAHERSVNTDILIGLMSRIVDLRAEMVKEDPVKNKPLKLIIMSATLRVSDFTENKRLFRRETPPIVQAEGRQYPVTMHFSRRTQRDYLEETFRKVSRGHKKLPKGGMLVFLTGQSEITALAKKLRQAFVTTDSSNVGHAPVRISANDTPLETEDIELGIDQGDLGDDESDDEDDAVIHGADNDEEKEFDIGEDVDETVSKVHVLPLYSQLPTNQQMRVFEPPPDGSRLIVLATNVAETSITIPNIRYVFDCGRAKEKKYDDRTGVQSFEISWISKASASQRAGRAGRTGPGHCYRLYSSAVYERDFEEYALPELLRTPIEGIVLQLKSMHLKHVVNFPFPTPPDRQSLAKAERLLSYLGALTSSNEGDITKLGREFSLYPLNPRFARMLVMGQAHNLTAFTIGLVAALSIPEIFMTESQLNLPSQTTLQDGDEIRTNEDNLADTERARILKRFRNAHANLSQFDRTADCIKLLSALGAFTHASASQESRAGENFCEENFLRLKALQEAVQLRGQLSHIVRTHRSGGLRTTDAPLPVPTAKEISALTQICAAGYIDQVAIRADLAPSAEDQAVGRKPKRAIDVPYLPLFPTKDEATPFVYIHPSSLLALGSMKTLPMYIIYSRLQRSASSVAGTDVTPKVRMHPLTPLTTAQLRNLAKGTPLVRFGKPTVGSKTVELPRDEHGVQRRENTVGVSMVPGDETEGSSGVGWSLGIMRIVERKDRTKGWVYEREVVGA